MKMRLIITAVILIVCGALCQATNVKTEPDSTLKISLLTARAGSEIYQLEGHTALRIQDPTRGDYVVNWGLFDFASPNFVYRFVKGETDYLAGATSTQRFLDMYRREGRKVIEQELRLNTDQAILIRELTDTNLLPENRIYRYNYVLDNCATRPLSIIEQAIGDTLKLGPSDLPQEATSSFRNAMRHYHSNYPWYQFGIDLALGSGIDRNITRRELSFAPEALESMLATASLPTGEPVVKATNTLVESGKQSAVLPPTQYPMTPMFWGCIVLAISIILSFKQKNREGVPSYSGRIFDTVYFGLLGLTGLVTAFLIFISVHEATSPNWLLLWTNPLCLFPAIAVWVKKWEKLLICYQMINFVLLVALLLIFISGAQSPNPAFIPLIAADALRALSYIIPSRKNRCHHAKTSR